MRVLVVHNRYSSRVPSGENLSVEAEVDWLRDAGVEVHTHYVSNDDAFEGSPAQRVGQAAWATWSWPAQRRIAAALDQVRPDLVHVHNLFPLLTASVPWTATRRGLPVVWTVRNQRVTCVDGTHFRDGQPCHLCRPGWRLPGVRYACYRESTVASALVTGATSIFRTMARRQVAAVAISRFMRDWLVTAAGFPAERIYVKYNGIAPPPGASTVPEAARQRTLLFAGKLAPYKGVRLLLDAWRRASLDDVELRIVGDGPLAADVRAAAAGDTRIKWIGQVPGQAMPGHFAEARCVVVPSTWEEPFGRTAAEAAAYGRPVVTSGLGGLGEIIDDESGWVTGTDPDALAKAMTEAATSDRAVAERGEAARTRHRRLFSPEATTRALLDIYESRLEARRTPGRPGQGPATVDERP